MIKLDRSRYTDIASCVGYLQTRAMPYVSIQRLALEQTDSDPSTNRLSCTLNIFFRIPDDGKGGEDAAPQSTRNAEQRRRQTKNDPGDENILD